MHRRTLFALLIALFALGPMPTLARPFVSDRITVSIKGSGSDVILIPGLTSSPDAWKYAVEAVPGHRYHLVQVKGFAGSPAEGNAKGDLLNGVSAEIARYIATEKLNKPAIIGHSMGGTIALMIGARHPQAISRLMVVDQVPFMGALFAPPGSTIDVIRPIAEGVRGGMRAATPEARQKNLEATTTAMVRNTAERPNVLQAAIASDRAVSENTFYELVVTDLRPELPKITVPAEILYVTPAGPQFTDAQIDAGYAAFYAGIQGAKLTRVPDSAHFVMYDNPDFFHAAMKAFLQN
jgi:pimeloyl-ACP methyl ester carboxylesterase